MWTIISRYVLKKFLTPFAASFGGLCLLGLFVKFVDRLDRILAEGVNLGHVVGYLACSMPFQAMNMFPIATLMATLYVVGYLMRSREYVAGLAGGISPEKILGGILIAGCGISLLAFIFNETVVPPTTRYATAVYKTHIQHLGEWRKTTFYDFCVLGTDGRIWNAKKFDQSSGLMDRVIVDSFTVGKMGVQVDAKTAQWTPAGWVFKNGVARYYELDGTRISHIERFSSRTFPFNEKPDELVIQDPQPEQMNYQTLAEYIHRLSALGVSVRSLEIELNMKLAFPVTCFVVTFLGIPISLKGRGNIAQGIAAGCGITVMFLGFIQFGKALALRIIPVWLGAWVGNIVFLALGTYFWMRLKRGD